MTENIDNEKLTGDRRASLASLTIGQLAQEYTREFGTPADVVSSKGQLIERLLLKLQHELEREGS